jgi:hypothetical protein
MPTTWPSATRSAPSCTSGSRPTWSAPRGSRPRCSPSTRSVGAGIARGLTRGVKLAAADGAVIIGVETVKAGVGAAGPAGLQGGAALIGRDRTFPIGICGRQALKALADELGLAEAAIAIGIGTHGAGRSLLGGRSTGRGQQKRGEAAGE